jgi:hypothetical protein
LLITIAGLLGSIEGLISAKLGWDCYCWDLSANRLLVITCCVGRWEYYASCLPVLF